MSLPPEGGTPLGHKPTLISIVQSSRWFAVLWIAALAALAALGGCSVWTGSAFDEPDEPVYQMIEAEPEPGLDHPAVVEKQLLSVPTAVTDAPPDDYVVGPNDVLHINVFGQPEMGSPVVAGTKPLGSRVNGNGEIQLPMVDNIHVAGLTVGQIQEKLKAAFVQFIAKPWVVVEVLEHGSQPVYLVGQFKNPGVVYLDRPTNLLRAIAMGLGLTETADIRGARVLRGDQVLPVDIYRLLREGAFDQNVWLEANDTVYVPDNSEQRVFVLGDVGSPGAVAMVHGRLTLAQALTEAGGPKRIGVDWKRIGIIRSLSPTRGELIVVDLNKILSGQTLPYPLLAGDVIYVPKDSLGEWNEALQELLPTLQTVGAVLQPFVQIKFLSE